MSDTYHFSTLARWLLLRALQNRAVVGHAFYWLLRAELHDGDDERGAASSFANTGNPLCFALDGHLHSTRNCVRKTPGDDEERAGAAVPDDSAHDESASRFASRERALLLLETYLRCCGLRQIEALTRQAEFVQRLYRAAALAQEAPERERLATLVDELERAPLERAAPS